MNAEDVETKIIFVFFFNFFQYVWPELMKGHIKIWNSELRVMYANVFFSTKCMQMLFLCLSSGSNKIYKILYVNQGLS